MQTGLGEATLLSSVLRLRDATWWSTLPFGDGLHDLFMVMLVDDDDIYGDVSGWVFKMCVFFFQSFR